MNSPYRNKYAEYFYDFGDSWEHSIRVVGTAAASEIIKCPSDQGGTVPEDCGGVDGWESLKKRYWQRQEAGASEIDQEEGKMCAFQGNGIESFCMRACS